MGALGRGRHTKKSAIKLQQWHKQRRWYVQKLRKSQCRGLFGTAGKMASVLAVKTGGSGCISAASGALRVRQRSSPHTPHGPARSRMEGM